MSSFLACSYSALCSGCDGLLLPASEQEQLKVQALESAWKTATNSDLFASLPAGSEISFLSIDKGYLRDRTDLMIDEGRDGRLKLGLFDRHRFGLVDLQGCPQLSSALEDWLVEFRKVIPRVRRGSVRLRVSPSGLKGVWLDFANLDVKHLLDDRIELDRLRATGAIIEIGQKRKRLVEKEAQLKLVDPILEPWFETYLPGRSDPISLFCSVGSFTQPGFRANRSLIEEVSSQVHAFTPRVIAEFGSGIGNFTLPLASIASEIRAYEVDELALQGMRRSLALLPELESKIQIHSGNFQVDRKTPPDFSGVDLMFVDPPRSGLMKFLDPIEIMPEEDRPEAFVYVSCFAESFAKDSRRLLDMGYVLRRLSIVDQFPQSRHFEIVSSFERRR